MKKNAIPQEIAELLLQSLAHEKGGVLVYETALRCVINEDLEEEWIKYLQETKRHVEVLTSIIDELGIDAQADTLGVQVVNHMGKSLVAAMEIALEGDLAEPAQLVACECVTLAETKDHLNWELIGRCAEKLLQGDAAKLLKDAYDEIEDQEDEHLYHTRGWCRELWIESLGMRAILPPPEEEKHVTTAIGAAKAEQASEKRR